MPGHLKQMLKRLRMAILLHTKYRLKRCGKGSYIAQRVKIQPHAVSVGRSSFIGPECFIYSQVEIGNFVMLASRVAIVGGDHRIDVPGIPAIEAGRDVNHPVHIHDDVWVGYGAVIMHGVTIGEGAVIAAGAVVAGDVEPYTVVGGVPAKLLRRRFDPEAEAVHRASLATRRPGAANDTSSTGASRAAMISYEV